MITIGSTLYLSDSPGHFWLASPGTTAGEIPPLIWLRFTERAEDVRFDGSSYQFNVPPPTPGIERNATATGEATISDGLMETLKYRLTYQDGTMLSLAFSFSALNSGITVNAPPEEQVESSAPSSNDCALNVK
jgi:hypothetical protein